MNDIIKNIEAAQMKQSVPEFRVGDTVKVSAKIKEGNRERIQVFEGTVIKRQGGSNRETFTVRKLSNGVGVEKTWPLHSPFVEDITVVRRGKARRAKLFYLRGRIGKAAKVKEIVKEFFALNQKMSAIDGSFIYRVFFHNVLRRKHGRI